MVDENIYLESQPTIISMNKEYNLIEIESQFKNPLTNWKIGDVLEFDYNDVYYKSSPFPPSKSRNIDISGSDLPNNLTFIIEDNKYIG